MSFIQQIQERCAALSEAEYDYTNTSDFTACNTLNDDCNAIVMEATVIYLEIKNINVMLKTGKRLTSRIYKIYYNALNKVCQETGGHLNCYSPHSFLLIYPKSKYDMTYVVDVALKIANLLSVDLKDTFEKHGHNNFSMGIDNGNILGTKTGNDLNSNQLSWFGNSIEKARTICNLCQRPFFVGISGTVFHHLDDSLKKINNPILGIRSEVDIWSRVSYLFENVNNHLYQTNFRKSFSDEE